MKNMGGVREKVSEKNLLGCQSQILTLYLLPVTSRCRQETPFQMAPGECAPASPSLPALSPSTAAASLLIQQICFSWDADENTPGFFFKKCKIENNY